MRDTIFTFDITPMGKPRMTQRDKWKNTRTAQADRYLVYKDSLQMLCRQNKFIPSDSMRLKFFLPCIKESLHKHPHQQKPDIDNLVKGFLDSVMNSDQTVYHIDTWKIWTKELRGRIEVEHF